MVAARQQRDATDQLGDDAASGPHVDGSVISRARHEQLRRAVPARHHVLGELIRVSTRIAIFVGDAAGEAKVADLEAAVAAHQKVGRLEIAVEHTR